MNDPKTQTEGPEEGDTHTGGTNEPAGCVTVVLSSTLLLWAKSGLHH